VGSSPTGSDIFRVFFVYLKNCKNYNQCELRHQMVFDADISEYLLLRRGSLLQLCLCEKPRFGYIENEIPEIHLFSTIRMYFA